MTPSPDVNVLIKLILSVITILCQCDTYRKGIKIRITTVLANHSMNYRVSIRKQSLSNAGNWITFITHCFSPNNLAEPLGIHNC